MVEYRPVKRKEVFIINYEINFDTQVIMPIGKDCTKIYELGDEYIVNSNSHKILEHSCEYFGSSYEGRREGTKKILGITHKAPIIIEESRQMIFFPTTSPDNINCIWINLEKIDKYFKSDSRKTAIIFKDGTTLEFDVSYGSLSNQIMRATRLKYVLNERLLKKGDKI